MVGWRLKGGNLKIATAAGGKKALAPAAAVGSPSAAKGGSTSFAVMMAKARAKVAAGKDAKEAKDAQLGGKIAKL